MWHGMRIGCTMQGLFVFVYVDNVHAWAYALVHAASFSDFLSIECMVDRHAPHMHMHFRKKIALHESNSFTTHIIAA